EHLEVDFAIGKSPQLHQSRFESELLAHLFGQSRIGAAGEYFDTVGVHRAYRLRGGHISLSVCGASARIQADRYWARLTYDIGNTLSCGNDFIARSRFSASSNKPKIAEPLPVIALWLAPRSRSRFLIRASSG